jgi:hypothetical protein
MNHAGQGRLPAHHVAGKYAHQRDRNQGNDRSREGTDQIKAMKKGRRPSP